MIYLLVRSITAKAAKNRTIPLPSKTVNSQTAKNSAKTDNNLKFNSFYFETFKTILKPNSTTYLNNTKGRLKSFSDDLVFSYYLIQSTDFVILVGKLFFHTFAAFLCFYGKCSSRAGKEAFETNGLAGICAEAVLAFVDATDGCLYFT